MSPEEMLDAGQFTVSHSISPYAVRDGWSLSLTDHCGISPQNGHGKGVASFAALISLSAAFPKVPTS